MAKRSLSPIQVLCFIVVFLFAGLAFYEILPIEHIERAAYVLESRLSLSEKKADQRIILVEIDDRSIDILGSWPWPRHLLAEMVDLLRRGGAGFISLNIPLIEKERDKGFKGVREIREKLEAYNSAKKDFSTAWIQEDLTRLEESGDDDQKLVDTIRQHGNVLLPVISKMERGQREVAVQHDSIISRDPL